MDIQSTYLGLNLKNPLIISSSGLTNSVEKIKKLAEAGAGAVVLKSLFEEQIIADPEKMLNQDDMYFWYPEAIQYLSENAKNQGLDQYLSLISDSKKAVDIPVIASINCVSNSEWTAFAKSIEKAGADAIELNIAIPANELNISANTISDTYLQIVKSVKRETNIPLAVKIGYHFNNIVRMAFKLASNGADGIVMFNRYYRPDIDIDYLNVIADNNYSSPAEQTIALRWIALTHHQIRCNLAAATGIHDHSGVIKAILCGAAATQICSTVYKNGVGIIHEILTNLQAWMQVQNFNNIANFKGLLSENEQYKKSFERLQFMKKSLGAID